MPRHADLRYTFTPLVGDAEFEVVSFTLDEALSTPFQLKLDLVSHQHDVDFGNLLDQPVLFTISRGGRPVRYVHGLVSTFSQSESGFRRTGYHALVEPQLARAGLRSNWRIFQNKSAPEILAIMLKRQGIAQFNLVARRDHQVREFCVQAGETDLDFINRLAAEEGFIYRFEHAARRHTLLISDCLLAMGTLSRGAIPCAEPDDVDPDSAADTVLYRHASGGTPARPCLRRLRYSEQVRSARLVQRDYTFTHPGYRQQHSASGSAASLKHHAQDYERFEYPGRYKRDVVGKPFTETRLAALRHDAHLAEVEGDDVRLQPGLGFTLVEHPRDDFNVHWRVVSLCHSGTQFSSLEEEAAGDEQGTTYRQTALLVPGMAQWRPAPPDKPHVDGPHMATVVGPPGEEIHCDRWGRVKVSFPWDRESRDDAFSSCWVRVAQGWAGGSWGSMAIPRIGNDVVIQYVNGDPDQPMITGRTYCGNQLPPYDLPEYKTCMTIKSQTHKGDGFNELRFEDELGREEVFMHAQCDHNTVVKHDQTTQVGNDRSEQVGRDEKRAIGQDRSDEIGRNECSSIGHNRTHTVGNDDQLAIEGSQTITTGKDRIETVGNHRHDSTKANHCMDIGGDLQQTVAGHSTLRSAHTIGHSTRTYTIDVSESLTIRSPAGLLRIDGAGITLDGIALLFKGPISQQLTGSEHSISVSGVAEPGEAVCVSCMRKAIADGRSLVRMEGTH